MIENYLSKSVTQLKNIILLILVALLLLGEESFRFHWGVYTVTVLEKKCVSQSFATPRQPSSLE